MDRKMILATVLEDPSEFRNFEWQGENGSLQTYKSLHTGNVFTIDAHDGRFYDERAREIHPVDAFAAAGIYSPNPAITERINAHVHEGREDVFEQSIVPATGGPVPQYQSLDYEPRGSLAGGEVHMEQHRYTGGLLYRDNEGHFVSFTNELRALSKDAALAGIVNYGPGDGTLEKLPPADMEIIRGAALEPTLTLSAEEYQALRAVNGPDWQHSVRVETPPPGLDGHYANDPNLSTEQKLRVAIMDDLYVYNEQPFYSPQLYDSMRAMNGPDWQHRVVVGPETWHRLAEINAETYGQERTAPEQNPATALSVEAAYPREYIAPNYEQALARWEAAVYLHEDLRGRPLTPQEYQQQVEINGPRWQHSVVLAESVDGTQNIYDRPHTQITPSDQILTSNQYERVLEHNGPEWLHSVLVRESFPLDPDARFQQAHREWVEVNEIYRENHGVPMSPQEYQTHQREWHQDSVVIVASPLESGLQRDDRAARSDAEMNQMESLSHPEYQELVRTNGPEWRHSVLVVEPPPEHYGFQLPTSWRDGPRIEHEMSEPQITPFARTEWTVEPGGGWEHRIHYGKSDDGYHYATEVSYNGGNMGEGELAWSAAYASQTEVKQAAHEAITELFQKDFAHDNGLSL